jgi:two-component system cell cycle sensor histidine kinase PleC
MLNTATDAIDAPAFVVRLDAPAIVEANARARAIWGIAASDDLPVAIDADMPAIRRLSAGQSGIPKHETEGVPHPEGPDAATAQLVFWTRLGAQRLHCRCRFRTSARDVLVVVIVDEAAPVATVPAPAGAARAATPAPDPTMPLAPTVDLRTMAHELRTPIGAVIALADMIDQEQFGPLGDPRYREYARDIRDSAHLALNIVAAALEHDQSEETILLGGIAEIDPENLLRKARRSLRLNAQAAGLAIDVEAAPGLPLVLANSPGLTQILLNLTANAIKFTPPGGHITLAAATTPGGGLKISVRDTGIGMTEFETSVLVEPVATPAPPEPAASSPAETSSQTAPGCAARPRRGIGFTLVRRLATAMGAGLEVTSERGVGTRVHLIFPPSLVIPREAVRGEPRE